jgi:hypothetical protein
LIITARTGLGAAIAGGRLRFARIAVTAPTQSGILRPWIAMTGARQSPARDMELAMPGKPMNLLTSRCACGGVEFAAIGAPIASAICYCASCQRAGRAFEALAGAPPLLEADGGTASVLFRKDRVRCVRGRDHLKEYRLKPESPTRRFVAACCNSAMLLDFTKGCWLTMYRRRFAEGAPASEARINTRDRQAGVALADDMPNYPGLSARLMMKVLAAWIAMGFRSPNFDEAGTAG